MINFIRNNKLVLSALLMSIATASQAAIDVSGVTTAVGEAGTAVAAIGAAVTLVFVGVKVYKWVQRSL